MDIFSVGCYAFCIFNLLILTLILWSRKGNGYRNIVFGFYILLYAVSLSFNLSYILHLIPIQYYYLCLFPALLLGPVAYTFCLLFMGRNIQKKQLILLHYLPAITGATLLSICTVFAQQQILDADFVLLKGHGIPDFFRYLLAAQVLGYHLYCWHISKKQLQLSAEHTKAVEKQIHWVYDFFKNMLFIFILFLIFHSIRFMIVGYSEVGSSVISPLVLSLSYILILYKSLPYTPVFSSSTEEEKNNPSKGKKTVPDIEQDQIALIEEKLLQVFEKEKLFKDQTLNLHALSDRLGLSPKILSQFIYQHYEIHFNDFINTYRVEESKYMMQDPSLNHLKLEAIAEAAGFSSRASFFSIFKKITGKTPAAFRKENSGQ